MARILLLLLSATTAGAFKVSRRCAAPARTLLRAADDAATDLQDLMAKQHTSTLDAVATAKKEVYDAYAEKIRALESRVAAAAALATAAAPGVAEAWSGAREILLAPSACRWDCPRQCEMENHWCMCCR